MEFERTQPFHQIRPDKSLAVEDLVQYSLGTLLNNKAATVTAHNHSHFS